MKAIFSLAAALLLTVGPASSLAQGRGNGPDGPPGRGGDRDNPGKGKGNGKGQDNDSRRDQEARREGPGNNGRRGPPEDGRRDRDDGPVIVVDRDRDRDRDRNRNRNRDRDDRDPRIVVIDRDPDPRIVVFTADRDRGLIAGCPPGLAKRNNGCLPPGQERKIAPARYDWLWDRAYGDNRFNYRYDNGYVYRYDRQGSLLGYLPALAGALGIGSVWPEQYRYDPAPAYYSSYYGLNQPYDYRYANGALYGVDPQTQAIRQVAALLTGQSPRIGQPMPPGYDIYNVPYAYRDQYYDTPERLYRYSDGYMYQLDPTTQVIQAVIQLLT